MHGTHAWLSNGALSLPFQHSQYTKHLPPRSLFTRRPNFYEVDAAACSSTLASNGNVPFGAARKSDLFLPLPLLLLFLFSFSSLPRRLHIFFLTCFCFFLQIETGGSKQPGSFASLFFNFIYLLSFPVDVHSLYGMCACKLSRGRTERRKEGTFTLLV